MILTFVEIPSNHNEAIGRPITLSPQGHLWKHGSLVILNYSTFISGFVHGEISAKLLLQEICNLGEEETVAGSQWNQFQSITFEISVFLQFPRKFLYIEETGCFPQKLHLKKMDMECSCIKSPPPIFSGQERSPFCWFFVGSRKVVIVDPPRQGLHQEVEILWVVWWLVKLPHLQEIAGLGLTGWLTIGFSSIRPAN